MKNSKGITLVALVITIIILIILAGISINILLGENGIIDKTKQGAENYQKAAEEEQKILDQVNVSIDSNNTGNINNTGNKKVIIKETMQEVEVTSSNIASLIGKEVVYNPTGDQDSLGNARGHWRIFYLDTTNKYGDGINTVYLKRDIEEGFSIFEQTYKNYTSNITDEDEMEKITNYLKKMNPEWGKKDGIISSEGERFCAYLCNQDEWNTRFLDGNLAKYVIGASSVEMYMDAYNQWGAYSEGKGPQSYKFDDGSCGYSVGVNDVYSNGSQAGYQKNKSIESGPNNIFMTEDENWWLSSPARNSSNTTHYVDGNTESIWGDYYCTNKCCPIVALK